MMNSPPKSTRRRWSTFSLRALLLLVTIAAIASWVYWTAWPRWQTHREQMEFEAAVRNLKIGSTTANGMGLVSGKSDIVTKLTKGAMGQEIARTDYIWPNAIYSIYYTLPPGSLGLKSQAPCLSIEVFRLPMPSDDAFAKRVAEHRAQTNPVLYFLSEPTAEYLAEFTKFISGDRKGSPPMAFELIYSDLPAAAESP